MKTNSKIVSLRNADKQAGLHEPEMAKLAECISTYAPHDGLFDLAIPGLHVSRFSRVNEQRVHALHLPALCMIARGGKTVIVGPEIYKYDASRMLVFSVALPVSAHITEASFSEPYLAFRLDFEPAKIADLVLKVFPQGLPQITDRKAVYVAPQDTSIINAATRLIECLAQPGDVALVAPLVVEEILIRLLRGPMGVRVAQVGLADSSLQRIAKAISWLRANFSQTMKVQELAEQVNMSASSFHGHFKSVTSMSPFVALSKSIASPGGAAPHAVFHDGRGYCVPASGLLERIAV